MFELNIPRMENAAFDDDKRGEVARLLREVADKVISGQGHGHLYDANGNKVGSWLFYNEED